MEAAWWTVGGREHATGSDLGLCRSVFCLSLVCKMQAVIPSCKSRCGCVWHRVCVRDQVQAHQDVLARIGQVMPQGQEPPNPNGSGRPKLLSPSCDCLSALQLPLCCGCHSRAGADAEANYSLALRAEHTRHAWPPADRAIVPERPRMWEHPVPPEPVCDTCRWEREADHMCPQAHAKCSAWC